MDRIRVLRPLFLTLLALALASAAARAHCQIPCGIYGDETRFTLMEEHVATIEKSMQQIVELGAAGEKSWNQLVRWVGNKEDHADQLAVIVTEYFLQQRIQPFDGGDAAAQEKYLRQITLCHEMLVTAMKAKQTTDLAQVEKLRSLIHDFAHVYMGGEAGHKH